MIEVRHTADLENERLRDALRRIGVDPTPDQRTCREIAQAALDSNPASSPLVRDEVEDGD